MKQRKFFSRFALPAFGRSRARVFKTFRAAACLAALLSPDLARAQQATDGDDLADLRKQLQAIAARIDALEKQRGDAASNHAQHGGPAAILEAPASTSLVVAPPSTVAQETAPPANTAPAKVEPFAYADWTWLNGNPRTKEPAFDTQVLHARNPRRHGSTPTTSTIPQTTPSADQARSSVRAKSSSRSWASAATSTTTTCAPAS